MIETTGRQALRTRSKRRQHRARDLRKHIPMLIEEVVGESGKQMGEREEGERKDGGER